MLSNFEHGAKAIFKKENYNSLAYYWLAHLQKVLQQKEVNIYEYAPLYCMTSWAQLTPSK